MEQPAPLAGSRRGPATITTTITMTAMMEMLLFDVVFHHRLRAERQVVRVVAPGPETVGEGIARRRAPEAVTDPEDWFFYGVACRGPANGYDEVDGTAD